MSQHTAADYYIGCICPMGTELAAVEGMLDEIHQPSFLGQHQNAYTLGAVGPHNIAIAILPEIGNVATANIGIQLLHDFPAIQFTLLVGIGGGVPGACDVRLGDVVVGGVIQYDIGKRLDGGNFQVSGHLIKPSSILNTYVHRLEAQYHRVGHTLETHLDMMLQKWPKMRSVYSRPKAATDLLFSSSYSHQVSDIASCVSCDYQRTINRPDRISLEPLIHYGTIGSANIVLKDASIRDKLQKDFGIICVEMEAAGLAGDFPRLVIRGICDYADSHKNKVWQPYAAAMAAAYMKDLLLSIPASQAVATSSAAQYHVTEYHHRNRGISQNRIRRATYDRIRKGLTNPVRESIDPQRIDAFLKGLYLTDPEEHLMVLRRKHGKRIAKTCEWLLETKAIRSWLGNEPTSSILWLYGLPGTGKSIMSMYLIEKIGEQCEGTDSNVLAYFFCDASIPERRTVEGILRGLLYQILKQDKRLVIPLLNLFEERGSIIFTSLDSLWKMFFTVAADTTKSIKYCIVDAIDECDRESLMTLLEQIHDLHQDENQPLPSAIRFLFTSRPYPEIREYFGDFPNICPPMWAEYAQDIHTFINNKVQYLQQLKQYPSMVASKVTEILFNGAGGTFLWIGLACNELKRVPAKDAVTYLRQLPKNIHQLYAKMLNDAMEHKSDQDKSMVARVIGFVAVLKWPMTLGELARACEISSLRDDAIIADDELTNAYMRDWIDECRLLVVIQDQRVSLLHRSVMDFIEQEPLFGPSAQLHAKMAYRCIDYILQCFDENYWLGFGEIEDEFLIYATENWAFHARAAGNTFDIRDEHKRFFALESDARAMWIALHRGLPYDETTTAFSRSDTDCSLFHISGALGLPRLFTYGRTQLQQHSRLLRFNREVLQPHFLNSELLDSQGDTPITLAAKSKYPDTLQLMLGSVQNRGATVNGVLKASTYSCDIPPPIFYVLLDNADSRLDLVTIIRSIVTDEVYGSVKLHHILPMIEEWLLNDQQTPIQRQMIEMAAMNGPEGVKILEILLEYLRIPFRLDESIIVASIEGGTEILQYLMACSTDIIHITERILCRAAEDSDIEFCSLLVHNSDLTPSMITEKVLIAAITNTAASELPGDLFKYFWELGGDHCKISVAMLKAAAGNPFHGAQLIEKMLAICPELGTYVTEEVVFAALTNSLQTQASMLCLYGSFRNQICVTEDMLVAGAAAGASSLHVLLEAFGDPSSLLEKLVEAAATFENRYEAAALPCLLNAYRDDIIISETCLVNMANNVECGYGFMVQILLEHGKKVSVTERIIVAAARSHCRVHRILQLLIDTCADALQITENVVSSAAANPYGPGALQLLLHRYPHRIMVTTKVLEAAASNGRSSVNLRMLLDRCKTRYPVTQDMLCLAAAVPRGGGATMKLLLERCHDYVEITEHLLLSAADKHTSGLPLIILAHYIVEPSQLTEKVLTAVAIHKRGVDFFEMVYDCLGAFPVSQGVLNVVSKIEDAMEKQVLLKLLRHISSEYTSKTIAQGQEYETEELRIG